MTAEIEGLQAALGPVDSLPWLMLADALEVPSPAAGEEREG